MATLPPQASHHILILFVPLGGMLQTCVWLFCKTRLESWQAGIFAVMNTSIQGKKAKKRV